MPVLLALFLGVQGNVALGQSSGDNSAWPQAPFLHVDQERQHLKAWEAQLTSELIQSDAAVFQQRAQLLGAHFLEHYDGQADPTSDSTFQLTHNYYQRAMALDSENLALQFEAGKWYYDAGSAGIDRIDYRISVDQLWDRQQSVIRCLEMAKEYLEKSENPFAREPLDRIDYLLDPPNGGEVGM